MSRQRLVKAIAKPPLARYQGPAMPWALERAGNGVQVRIELPVDDREDLYDAIKTEMAQKTSEIAIPVALPGASRTCANMLEILRRTLDNTGIPFAPAG